MSAEDVILVTGATGNTGFALLQQLETRGARVRAMLRDPSDKRRLRDTAAAIVAGNFDDRRSIEAALTGVTRARWPTQSRSRCRPYG